MPCPLPDAVMPSTEHRTATDSGGGGGGGGGVMKQPDLKGSRQDAVHQATTGDTDATAHCIPHNSSNGVQSCCCHLNAGDDCNAATNLV